MTAFGLLLLAFAIAMIAIPDSGLARSGRSAPVLAFMLPLALVFGGLGLLVTIAGLRPLLARLRLAAPEVSISATRLCVGDAFTAAYRQAFKGAADVSSCSMRLVLRETAVHGSGKQRTTQQHEELMDSCEMPGRRYEAGETLDARHTFRIPATSMHSFKTYSNQVAWWLRIQVRLAGWADWSQDYELTVAPERAL